jgi:hypothetical protein
MVHVPLTFAQPHRAPMAMLRSLHRHLLPGAARTTETETTVGPTNFCTMEAAAAQLAAGTLDPGTVPAAWVRELMRPEPGFLGLSDSPTRCSHPCSFTRPECRCSMPQAA